MKQKLEQYVGHLDYAGVAEGINSARANARRLAADAKMLLDADRFPSAAALAVLSIEESGKCSILRSLALADGEDVVRRVWKEYRSHTKKNAMWLLPSLVAQGARRLGDFAPLFDDKSDHPFVLDQVKQISLYSDCLGRAHWARPDDVIDKPLAATLVRTAEVLASGSEVTSREIELWIKHMKPVSNRTPEWQRKALANWYAEMQAEGLASAGSNEMETFIWHGFGGADATE